MASNPLEPTRARLREWHRDAANRRVAGVCAGVARQLDVSVTVVRTVFILLTVFPGFHAVGLFLYAILWFLMPAEPGAPSGVDRVIDALDGLLGDRRRDGRSAGHRDL